jgi:hypothetical protein
MTNEKQKFNRILLQEKNKKIASYDKEKHTPN